MQTPLSARRAFDAHLDRMFAELLAEQDDQHPTAGGFVAMLVVAVAVALIVFAGWAAL